MTEQTDRNSGDRERLVPIIRSFVAVVDELQLAPDEIRDVSALSHPKEEIADALVKALSELDAPEYSPAHLRGWLAALAQFQPDLGPPVCDPAAELARRMSAAKKRHQKVDAAALQKDIEVQAHEQRWADRRVALSPHVRQERDHYLKLLESEW